MLPSHPCSPSLFACSIPPSLSAQTRTPKDVYSFVQSLRGALELTLQMAFAPTPGNANANANANASAAKDRSGGNKSDGSITYIADIEPVLASSIYGFSTNRSLFLKISVYLPSTVSRIATLFTHRALPPPFDTLCLVHEAHIPFTLQFLTDYALAGMDYIHLSSCKFRLPMPPSSDGEENDKNTNLMGIPMNKRVFSEAVRDKRPDLFWSFAVSKRSTSALELDAFEGDILNARMNETSTPPGERSGFINRTLEILWQEERLRTGVLPPRIVQKSRDVIAGAHLSPPEMLERLEEILASRPALEDEGQGDGIVKADSIENGDGSVIGSQNIPLSDVLNYLDSSLSQLDDDREDADIDEDEDDIDEKQMSIEQTWRDIAECTQSAKIRKDSGKRGQPQSESAGATGSSIPTPPETPRTPYATRTPRTPRTPRTRTPSQSQSQSQSNSQSLFSHQDRRNIVILKRKQKPPRAKAIQSVALDAKRIEWGTPFYSSSTDVRSANIRPFGYGEPDVRVRDPGASGFPSASLPFKVEYGKDVPVTASLVTPARKPPTFSQLRAAADARSNWGSGAIGNANGKRLGIDSAGRIIGIREASATKGLSLTPPLLSGIIDVLSLRDADELIQWKRGDENEAEEGAFQDVLEESPAVLRLSRTLQRDKRNEEPFNDSDSHLGSLNVVEEDDGNNAPSNQFLSPKYDETFQITAKQFQGTRPSSSSARETPRRSRTSSIQGSAPEENAKNSEGTATLSESPHKYQNISFMSIETNIIVMKILAKSFGDKLPDPTQNELLAVCTIQKTDDAISPPSETRCTVLAVRPIYSLKATFNIEEFNSENELFDGLAKHIRISDPDVLVGFEAQASSIGFILERAQTIGHHFGQTASRWLKTGTTFSYPSSDANNASGNNNSANVAAAYYNRKGADVYLTGRHIISLWRVVRTEVKLSAYSREIVAAELFDTTFPLHSNEVMETWYLGRKTPYRAIHHLIRLTILNVAIVDKLHVLSRTGELARVYGIDFMSVLTRGSQFRVESMMRRVAKARGFLLLSAARDQVFKQPAVEALPLVMEPYSGLYVDPVVVLDFQSLYPSVIIAHNLCFSTMLGNANRVQSWDEMRRVGVMPDYTPPILDNIGGIDGVRNHVFVASNGEMFVDASVRRGILPQMLDEILETRIMVKTAMKSVVNDYATSNLLNARQFGLKMIANVTYGYTSASFSGRMPCAGLADAIVQCGRDALEQICDFVDDELHSETGARIVYGDTDSLFVQVPGATREEAFKVGERIVTKASKMFPAPMALKLEKVYQPCVMQTKKRYVGYCYEKPGQAVPEFDAKGIETVRRDTCPLVQKALERAVRLLFETRDLSVVKRDLQRLCTRIQTERVPLAEFVFRREVRLGSYKEGHLPPAAIVASKAIEHDARAAPRHGERVPFVVVYEQPGAPLKDCVMAPTAFVNLSENGSARLNVTYYITKQLLPALDRVFSLIGARVSAWYADFPRVQLIKTVTRKNRETRQAATKRGQSVLPMFYTASACAVCRTRCRNTAICDQCIRNEPARQASRWVLEGRRRAFEQRGKALLNECRTCSKADMAGTVGCFNVTCTIFDELRGLKAELQTVEEVLDDVDSAHVQNETNANAAKSVAHQSIWGNHKHK